MAKKTKPHYDAIPYQVELFGRVIKTIYDTERMQIAKTFGEAHYGSNEIAISDKIQGSQIADDEKKMTYLHEMLHFILNFTGYEAIIFKDKSIDMEQFVELLASAIYQYEKTAKYK